MATIILLVSIVGISLWAFSNKVVFERYAFSAYMVKRRHQYDRFLTHAFIHGDINHLFVNGLVMFFFAPEVELMFTYLTDLTWGPILLFTLFATGAIVASIPDYFKEQDNQNYLSVGASGGVSAIVFASIVFTPLSSICLYGVLCFPGFIWGFVYLGYSYYQGKFGKASRINHGAHLWGALYGAIFMGVLLLLTGNAPII